MPAGTSAAYLRFGARLGLFFGFFFGLSLGPVFGLVGCEGGVDPGPSITVPADVKAPPADAKTTASGLAWKVLKAGQGTVRPKATDQVTVHYSGWTTDGALFDSSVTRGAPAQFQLNGVIKGWTEGVQLMVEGEESRFWIPAELAYGNNPAPGYPAGTLVFDIQLISITR